MNDLIKDEIILDKDEITLVIEILTRTLVNLDYAILGLNDDAKKHYLESFKYSETKSLLNKLNNYI